MKKLNEIIKLRSDKEDELKDRQTKFNNEKKVLELEIKELLRLENVATDNIDIEKVQIAEGLIYIYGNPYGKTSSVSEFGGKVIAEEAIIDIANNFEKLRIEYFGNKIYESYYQRCDCSYGMGPRHGSIVDKIGMKATAYKFTDEEKDACIYYIKNYNSIKKAEIK